MRLDLYNNVKTLTLLELSSRTASENGSAVDVSKYDGVAKAVLVVGDCTGDGAANDQTYDVKIQESDDASTWTDVVSFTQYTDESTATVEEKAVPLRTRKKYLRGVFTYGGTEGGTFPSALVLLVANAPSAPIS